MKTVQDRLAAYYHWNDAHSLEQAVLVAKMQKINLGDVKKWSIQEGYLSKFKIFLSKQRS